MGNGRYDFESVALTDSDFTRQMVRNDTVLSLVTAKLGHCGMAARVGALPTKNTQGAPGRWHRDQYSLFEDENLDLTLPCFYLTLIVPLVDLSDPVQGGGTEFVVGSHKMNFTADGVTNADKLK